MAEWRWMVSYACLMMLVLQMAHRTKYIDHTESQEGYYSGHRCYHAIHTQVIVDVNGEIWYDESGFISHTNDVQQYGLMRQSASIWHFQMAFTYWVTKCVLIMGQSWPHIQRRKFGKRMLICAEHVWNWSGLYVNTGYGRACYPRYEMWQGDRVTVAAS